jgi:hypothetical protein
MKRLGLATLLGTLWGCSSSSNDCASACNQLVGCLSSPACETSCRPATCAPLCPLLICESVCGPVDSSSAAVAEADCNDTCATRSSSQQAQILQCVTAATSCEQAFACN